MRKTLAAILIATMCAGCASTPRPTPSVVVDPQSRDMSNYDADLLACKRIADNAVDSADRAAAGAVAGAVLGVAVGLIFGLKGQSLARTAGTGAVAGGVGAGARGVTDHAGITKNCMSARGYTVLN